MEKVTKINLASGRMYIEGYLNVDDLSMNPKSKVDIKSDIKTFKRKGESVDEIIVSHFMMYLLPDEAQLLINRWYEWLKKRGELIIETSDAYKIAEMILDDYENIGQMFGYGATAGHKWAYTPESLKKMLKCAGFKRIVVSRGGSHNRPDRDFTIIATK